MNKSKDTEWTDKLIARLRELWAEGHSTAEIGRRMGLSKNAVVGKASRLDLPGRPSPIRGFVGVERPVVPDRRLKLQSLPPLASVDTPAVVVPSAPSGPQVAARPVFAAPPKIAVLKPIYAGRWSDCCFPFGTPGKPDFRFCGKQAVPNKPYCADCCERAYVRVRDHREGAHAD